MEKAIGKGNRSWPNIYINKVNSQKIFEFHAYLYLQNDVGVFNNSDY